jgi:predicted RNA-binding Zn-ribbon protein involved in translation (DUF1610 family)
MTVLATSKTRKFPGPEIKINCPKCGPNVPASTYRLEERMGLYFIPLFTQRETYVECPKCGSARLTDLTFDELAACPPDEIDRHVYQRVSIIVKFMAVASVLVFCVPFVGLGFGIAGFVASKRTGGWVKAVSLIGIVLGALGTLGMVAVMLSPKGP